MLKKVTVETSLAGNMVINVKTGNHSMLIDQPKAGGGEDKGPTPLQYFLTALAGCIGSISLIIAKQRRINLTKCDVKVEGELDTDVLMGKSNDSRAGFQWMKVYVDLDAEGMTAEDRKVFIHEVDERCPISDNIANTSKIEFIVE